MRELGYRGLLPITLISFAFGYMSLIILFASASEDAFTKMLVLDQEIPLFEYLKEILYLVIAFTTLSYKYVLIQLCGPLCTPLGCRGQLFTPGSGAPSVALRIDL